MLYKAVDMFPRSFDVARLNAATALVLPLQAAFYVPASSTLSLLLRVKNMLVSDVFQYQRSFTTPMKEDSSNSVSWSVASGKFKLQQYFVPLCNPTSLINQATISFQPFVNQLRLSDGQSMSTIKASSKMFRASVTTSTIPPLALRNISSDHWKMFWSLSLTAICCIHSSV
ncbi:hypothetical protein INT46_003801 [Mucor plumbeus]|uniref:Uncharacterized protein n=1 Tax=Mucor plumbeus TaxID=97098 RepID=A0A8H7V6M2_9FUNG|nr:hypothetical protein INT46_003801 [Mucor plumbeus]